MYYSGLVSSVYLMALHKGKVTVELGRLHKEGYRTVRRGVQMDEAAMDKAC